jgi:hypothetical protein
MNWNAIGAVSGIIGSFAVVISLVYLAIQARSKSPQAKFLFMICLENSTQHQLCLRQQT